MAKLRKTLKLTKLYPGLNKRGLGLPTSQLSQMVLNMTQINTFQLTNGTRLPWGIWRTIYYRGQRPRRLRIYTPLLLPQSTHGGGGTAGQGPILTHPWCCRWDCSPSSTNEWASEGGFYQGFCSFCGQESWGWTKGSLTGARTDTAVLSSTAASAALLSVLLHREWSRRPGTVASAGGVARTTQTCSGLLLALTLILR